MAKVIANRKVGPDFYKIEFHSPDAAAQGKPGQFVHLRVKNINSYDPLLRRPFSIFDINKNRGTISLVYRVLGKGTELLSTCKTGDILDLLGPLGLGFELNPPGDSILLIGGGMGIVPLYYLAKELVESKKSKIRVLIGGSDKNELEFFEKVFTPLDLNIDTASIDGSSGYRGTVLDLWKKIDEEEGYIPEYLYSCGPEPMLVKIQRLAEKHNIKGQVSLEERMGCGIGVCLSCVCKTKSGNKRLCKEGPVLPLDEVMFNE